MILTDTATAAQVATLLGAEGVVVLRGEPRRTFLRRPIQPDFVFGSSDAVERFRTEQHPEAMVMTEGVAAKEGRPTPDLMLAGVAVYLPRPHVNDIMARR